MTEIAQKPKTALYRSVTIEDTAANMWGFKDKASNSDIIAGGKAIRVLMMLKALPKDDAGLKRKIKGALAMVGFNVEAGGGGLLARYEGGVTSIVLDGRAPTKRSIGKACRMSGYRVIALKGHHHFALPHGINAVIKLDVTL